jgi:hypothetical protein
MPDPNPPAKDPAKDVLAAEAFGVPARDPTLTHGPVVLPADPTGIEEPHDVLAAEEFAMPAGIEPHDDDGPSRGPLPLVVLLLAAIAAAAILARRRRN